MSALDRMVTVYDWVPFTASPTPEQATAYVRRVLPTREGWAEREAGGAPWLVFEAMRPLHPKGFRLDGLVQVAVPMRPDFADYGRRMAELCDALVKLGVVARPSEALRAMAEERCT